MSLMTMTYFVCLASRGRVCHHDSADLPPVDLDAGCLDSAPLRLPAVPSVLKQNTVIVDIQIFKI